MASGHGGDGLMVGLDDLSGLFQHPTASSLWGSLEAGDKGKHFALKPQLRAPPVRLAKDQLLFIAHEWMDT